MLLSLGEQRGGSPPVELGHQLGFDELGQPVAQERLEQVVVAVGLDLPVVEPHREQMAIDESAHEHGRIGALGHGGGDRGGEAVEHRRGEQEPLDVGVLAREDLLGEVVQLGAALVAAGLGGHDQARGPALDLAVQARELVRIEAGPDAVQQRRRLVGAEGEAALADLEHPARPQPPQPQGHRLPARQGEVHDPGQVPEQAVDHLQRRRGQEVDVVQDQHDVLADGLDDLVAELLDLVLRGSRAGEARAEAGIPLREAGREVPQQQTPVADALVARAPHPAPVEPVDRQPQQRRLAVAGTGDHRHEAAVEPLHHLGDQGGPGHAGGRKLRRQQAASQDSLQRCSSGTAATIHHPPSRREPLAPRRRGRRVLLTACARPRRYASQSGAARSSKHDSAVSAQRRRRSSACSSGHDANRVVVATAASSAGGSGCRSSLEVWRDGAVTSSVTRAVSGAGGGGGRESLRFATTGSGAAPGGVTGGGERLKTTRIGPLSASLRWLPLIPVFCPMFPRRSHGENPAVP